MYVKLQQDEQGIDLLVLGYSKLLFFYFEILKQKLKIKCVIGSLLPFSLVATGDK